MVNQPHAIGLWQGRETWQEGMVEQSYFPHSVWEAERGVKAREGARDRIYN